MDKTKNQSTIDYALKLHAQANNAMLEAVQSIVDENGTIIYTHKDSPYTVEKLVTKEDDEYKVYYGGVEECVLEDCNPDEYYKMLTTFTTFNR